jgi:hypothetical protein
VLRKWHKNDDGTVTGRIVNSPRLKNDRKITTKAKVRNPAHDGIVFSKASKSKYKYRLE